MLSVSNCLRSFCVSPYYPHGDAVRLSKTLAPSGGTESSLQVTYQRDHECTIQDNLQIVRLFVYVTRSTDHN